MESESPPSAGDGAPIEAGADRAERLLAGLNDPQRQAVDPRRGAAAGPRRRRLGQDPGADPPHRLPAGDRRGPPGRDPRDHLHQQGGERDARAGRGAGRPLGAGDVGDHLPLGLRADAARRRREARLRPHLHDLRRVRLAADAQTLHDRAPESTRNGSRRGRSGRRSPAPRTSWSTPTPIRRAESSAFEEIVAEFYPLYEKRMLRGQRDGLRRPAGPHGQRAGALRGGARTLAPHLPPRSRRRVPGHQPRPVPTAATARRREHGT